ncbi:MFS transporter [Paenarthrobacter ilicis]|uniref:MFS transporter n=1 Tax=Paenarthrobacter ilicis TaxID=43665 RepID=UPI0028D8F15A|nr:MFS transporter [Paenarthrobacter ilicis]
MSPGESSKPGPPTQKQVVRAVIASTVGTAVEWYDFILFGTASALVFNVLFFPDLDPLLGTVAAFATNAVGFLVRPLGGFIFGTLGDRFGRRAILIFTLIMMGLATTAMGLLPTYGQVGIAAPLLLLALRMIQGLGAGAEFAGAVIMVAEFAPPKHRTLLTSLPGWGNAIGLVLGAGIFSLLTAVLDDEQLHAWGWRIPFLLGAVGIVVGLWVRLGVMESPEFLALRESGKAVKRQPMREVFKKHPKNFLTSMAAVVAENGTSYLVKTFIITYIASFLMMDKNLGLNAILVASTISLATTPVFGHLGDRFGVTRVYLTATIFVFVFAFPFFWLIGTGSVFWTYAAVILMYNFGVRALGANQGALLSGLFPTHIRFSGVASSREVAAALSGGLPGHRHRTVGLDRALLAHRPLRDGLGHHYFPGSAIRAQERPRQRLQGGGEQRQRQSGCWRHFHEPRGLQVN